MLIFLTAFKNSKKYQHLKEKYSPPANEANICHFDKFKTIWVACPPPFSVCSFGYQFFFGGHGPVRVA
ncbi:unnamed protein product [Prunus armeniaca]